MFTAFTIARTTFLEAVRQPIYFILVMLCGVAMLLTTWGTGFSLGYTDAGEVSGDNKLLLDLGMATVFLCGVLLAGFIATATMSREIENKTVLTIVSKPVPRPFVVIGKFLGVTAAVMIAVVTMVCFLLMAIRHGVLSTAAQEVDIPVIVFCTAAVLIAIAIGTWGNFFYGWSFPQTATLFLCPLMLVATLAALSVGEHWNITTIATKYPVETSKLTLLVQFKPQVVTACICLCMAVIVLCAAAVAASTRLGQVMTILACFGLFVLGMLSSPLIGRHAFRNDPLGTILKVEPERERFESFANSGDSYKISLKAAPPRAIRVGDPMWYGPFPNGLALEVPSFTPFKGGAAAVADSEALFKADVSPAIVVTSVDTKTSTYTIRNIGGGSRAVAVGRPPRAGDYIFIRPTEVNPVALAAWGVIPNLQFFWLLDAVTQNQVVPFSHLALVALYTIAQVVVFVSLAVVLFQRRDVG